MAYTIVAETGLWAVRERDGGPGYAVYYEVLFQRVVKADLGGNCAYPRHVATLLDRVFPDGADMSDHCLAQLCRVWLEEKEKLESLHGAVTKALPQLNSLLEALGCIT
jgi:hypothetical protein